MEGERLDKFVKIKHLGSGEFGDVFHCFDPYLNKEIAVKIIKVPDPEKFVNAVNEWRVLELCRNRHIVDVKDVRLLEYNGEPVVIIVMEYLENGSVQKYIEQNFISTKQACKIMHQVLLGLEHAHNHDILHRDIKPGNIMFWNRKEAKISDFGLAIDYRTTPSDVMWYRPHQPLEVIKWNPMDKLSDIYASGVTFYRLLNNISELPFPYSSHEEWCNAVVKDKYPEQKYLPHIPEKVIRVLRKSMNKNKDSRFQNCTDFRQAIDKLNFQIDWTYIDDNNWVGSDGKNTFTISKFEKKGKWYIEYKRNKIRKNEYCHSELDANDVKEIFFKIIKETTIE